MERRIRFTIALIAACLIPLVGGQRGIVGDDQQERPGSGRREQIQQQRPAGFDHPGEAAAAPAVGQFSGDLPERGGLRQGLPEVHQPRVRGFAPVAPPPSGL